MGYPVPTRKDEFTRCWYALSGSFMAYAALGAPREVWRQEAFPALLHLDNSARPNGVRAADDPWMHSLLVAVRSEMTARGQPAVGVLLNTSLNLKDMPIAADAFDVLSLF